MEKDVRELLTLEQICLKLAASAQMECERAGLLEVAEDCRKAAAGIKLGTSVRKRWLNWFGDK